MTRSTAKRHYRGALLTADISAKQHVPSGPGGIKRELPSGLTVGRQSDKVSGDRQDETPRTELQDCDAGVEHRDQGGHSHEQIQARDAGVRHLDLPARSRPQGRVKRKAASQPQKAQRQARRPLRGVRKPRRGGAAMRPKAISLFSGAGGMDIGVEKAGFNNVCSIEMDPHCVSTLRRNASSRGAVWQVDITALDPLRAAGAIGLKAGDIALLHGGPPCQSFSQIGHKRGLKDPRGRLVFEMVRFADALRPTAIMIEQVPTFLDTRAAGRMTVLDLLAEEFWPIGYETHATVINALDFGVPQRRRRACIVCVPKGQPFAFPEPKGSTALTTGDALRGLPRAVKPDRKPLMPNHVDVTPDRDKYRISFVPEGLWLSKVKGVPSDVVRQLTAKDSTKFRRLDRKQPSLTLRCGEALYHPTEDRYLTPRESARIQGFPDNHILEGPIRRRTGVVKDLDQHRQVANAVPPPLAKAVASHVRAELCL